MYVQTVFAAAVILSSAAAISSDVPKQPTGKWIVRFDDARCVAERNYGTKEKPLHFVVKQPPLGNVLQFSIVRPQSSELARELDGTLEFPGRPRQKVSVLQFTPKKSRVGALMMNVPLDQFSHARTAATLRVRTEGFDETFALVQLGPVLDIMNTCVSDLRKVWNVDESKDGAGAVRKDAKGELRGLFSAGDYPWPAIESGEGGTVMIALLVSETGKVADCSVTQTSGVAALDAQSCTVVKERAKFTPAIGNDGKPAKQAFIQSITWRLE